MKNILLIGVGGTGSKAVDIFYQKLQELGNQTDSRISAIVFDTDKGDIEKITSATPIPMTDPDSVGVICDRLGKEKLAEWFPCGGERLDKAVCSQELIRGASQWRKKSFLSFLNLMNKSSLRMKFNSVLENVVKDASGATEVYVITSIAGGTGSGSFIPIALYAKKYLLDILGKSPLVNAMIALPDIYIESQQLSENKIKICANAYAIMREINAINMVAYDRFGENSRKKKAPINIKYGNEDDPNTRGVLFDSKNPQFWTPEAAPFNQIFLVDRIKGCTSVVTHNIQMADSLYNMICTGIGAEFDSEQSNHELIRAQSNASSAIFASVATTQMRFPVDSVLDYLAHSKALSACEGEWLLLHNEVKKMEQQKEKEAREAGGRYVAKGADYARLYLEVMRNEVIERGNLNVSDLVDFGTKVYDDRGNEKLKSDGSYETTVDRYFKKLDEKLNSMIVMDEVLEDSTSADTVDDLLDAASDGMNQLMEKYGVYLSVIKQNRNSFVESVLSFDSRRNDLITGEYSLVKGILMTEKGKYLHPVAAMVQLCRLRAQIATEIVAHNQEMEKDLRKRTIENLPDSILVDALESSDAEVGGKLWYGKQDKERFKQLCVDDNFKETYKKKAKKRKYKEELEAIKGDANAIAIRMHDQALNTLKYLVFDRIGSEINVLIDKYKFFFSRFEKEKGELVELKKNALYKDSAEENCGVFNVLSSKEAKEWIEKKVFDNLGAQTEEELIKTNDLVGKSVFETVYQASVAEVNHDLTYNDKDASAYRSLFAKMIDAYRTFISESDSFAEIKSYSIIEAIKADCARYMQGTAESDVNNRLEKYFSSVLDRSKPGLMINWSADLEDVILPNYCRVFMISENTAKYIKKSADQFNLTISGASGKSKDIERACAEDLVTRYAKGEGVRLVISPTLPDNMLYCSTEMMDVSPLRLKCFDELAHEVENTGIKLEDLTLDEQKRCSKVNFINYYDAYMIAVRRAKFHETDMWNPHLGFDWHKRGYLPFMNEKMEKECDDRMVKALIYGLNTGKIFLHKDGTYYASHPSIGGTKRIYIDGRTQIHEENVCKLISWFRNQDEMIDEWYVKFDQKIDAFKKKLPVLKPNDIDDCGALESKLTREGWFMHILYDTLTWKPEKKEVGKKGADAPVAEEKENKSASTKQAPCLLEFAYKIKVSEETERDCDDAERILDVAYSVFLDLVMSRTENNTINFNHVYGQQCACIENNRQKPGKIYTKLMNDLEKSVFDQMVTWMNDAQKFLIPNGEENEDVLSSLTVQFDKDLKKDSKKKSGDEEDSAASGKSENTEKSGRGSPRKA